MSTLSNPKPKDEGNSSCSESSSKDEKIFSSKRVGDQIYKLVSDNSTESIVGTSTPVNQVVKSQPPARTHHDKPRLQTARKSFPTPNTFKIPPLSLKRDAGHYDNEVVFAGRVPHTLCSDVITVPNPNITSQNVTKEELSQNLASNFHNKPQLCDQVPKDKPLDEFNKFPKITASKVNDLAFEATRPEVEAKYKSPTKPDAQPLMPKPELSAQIQSSRQAVHMLFPLKSMNPEINHVNQTSTSIEPERVGGVFSVLPTPNADTATVTETAPTNTAGEARKRSILSCMKREYSSGTSPIAKTSGSGSSDMEDPLGKLPEESVSTTHELANRSATSDDMPPTLAEIAEDSFDEELVSLAKKPRLCSPDEPPDLVATIQIDEQILPNQNIKDLTAMIELDIQVTSSVTNLKPPMEQKKPIPELQEVFTNPPTPAPTPQTDDLINVEAKMAAIHGESLDEIEDEKESNAGNNHTNSDVSFTATLSAESDSDVRPQKAKSSRGWKLRKIGPKSKVSQPCEEKKFKAAKPRNVSRELERLFIDEGAVNIMREMEGRSGANRRRTTTTNKTETLKEEKQPTSGRKGPGRPRTRVTTAKQTQEPTALSSNSSTVSASSPAVNKSTPQDNPLKEWEAIHNDAKVGEAVVYVPRKMINPADASQIVHRRSYSSDMSSDGGVVKGQCRSFAKSAPSVSLGSDGYTAFKNGIDVSDSTQRNSNDEIGGKLSSSFTEINVRCIDRLLHVTLCPVTSKLPNSLNSTLLRELTILLRKLKLESRILVVLITSAGPSFCTGIDFPSLLNEGMAGRLESAISTAQNVQDFITELANCDKLLVGGLSGSVIGLGVAMLPYFDIVYASDKSTFYLPYSKLSQNSEGGFTLTSSKNLLSLMVYEGRRLTATEAHNMGLVDVVLWPSTFQEDLMPRVHTLAAQSTQNVLNTKKITRASLRRDLPGILKEESQLLRQSWISDEFQNRARHLFASGDLLV